jgi:tRNA pseudouridine38-40 synthase
METYRLVLEYDGGRYRGWQVQQNAKSVAGELLRVLDDLGAQVIELGGAGRTDAGVHALAQVAHLRLRQAPRGGPGQLQGALNELLPKDIHVLEAAEAAPRFHARHDAELRSYVYQIARRRTAFAKPFVWWVRDGLDLARMEAAAALVPGRHDFCQFCQRPEDQESTLVEVERVEIASAGDLILIRIAASHFLWRMVRRVVGCLVKVGTGELSVDGFARLVAGQPPPAGRGTPAEWTAPAAGLFLERVLYRGDDALPSLAPVTPVGRWD